MEKEPITWIFQIRTSRHASLLVCAHGVYVDEAKATAITCLKEMGESPAKEGCAFTVTTFKKLFYDPEAREGIISDATYRSLVERHVMKTQSRRKVGRYG